MADEIRKYSSNELTVVWQPKLCVHSKLCWQGLIQVFNPKARPWVNIQGATADRIREQVARCPSGALSIEAVGEPAAPEPTPLNTNTGDAALAAAHTPVQVLANGPLIVSGTCEITLPDGRKEIKEGKVALCRCGASGNKPYCDGSHTRIGFTNA